jgi:hypothetical protein
MTSLALPLLAAALLQVRVDVSTQRERPDSAPAAADSAAHSRHSRARRPPRRIPLTAGHLATAYTDARTRSLVARARRARMEQDSSLLSYDATTYQRISAGMALGRIARDRLAFRHEEASRVRWRRGEGVWIDVKGSRVAVPIIAGLNDVHEPEDEVDPGFNTPIPYFPGREPLLLFSSRMMQADVDDRELVHPIAAGAEAYYTYAAGDSVTFRLPTGREIRLVEVRIRPRRPAWNVAVGSLWFDADGGQLVRAGYRLAVPMDIAAVAEQEDPDAFEDVPVWVKPMIFPMRAEVSAITVEYGLHEGRFWLPRTQYAEGEARVSFMRVPFKFETRFDYARVNGTLDSLPPIPEPEPDDSTAASDTAIATELSARDRDDSTRVSVGLQIGDDESHSDSAHRARRAMRKDQRARACGAGGEGHYEMPQSRLDGSVRVLVRVPCDSAALAHAPELPPSIYDSGEEVFGAEQREELLAAVGFGAQAGWAPRPPVIFWGFDRNLLRYNRVEGLSAGAGVRQEFGAGYRGEALAQIGIADLQPNAELSLARSSGRATLGLGVFRRLGVANDWGSPLSASASLSALLFGRDEGLYYRTWGAELTGTLGVREGVTWRLFAEKHSDAEVETQVSLAHAINGFRFPANIRATNGEVFGGALRATRSYGVDPQGWRLLADFRAEGGAGDFDYGRGALDMTISRGLGSRLAGALTVGGGTSGGSVPLQRRWYLGDSRTVRGQRVAICGDETKMLRDPVSPLCGGDAYWLARAELGAAAVAARPVIFADLGWAGDRDDFWHPGRPLAGVGTGASFLDGMIRFDLSHGLYPRRGWRGDLYLEARF